jgi:U2 small nuclear ribonucleoprotein A'
MRLTAEVARDSPAYINPLRQRELSLRGFKIPVIENLGATQDQYAVIDLTDNEILKIDNFPNLTRLEALLLADNRICRVSRGLGKALPKLDTIILTNNKLSKFSDLKPLSDIPTLTTICLLGNPVASLNDYRLFVIHRLPNLKVLDFAKVKQQEREAAKAKYGELKEDEEEETEETMEAIGETLTAGGESTGPTAEERAAIMEKIKTATSLAEIEALEKQLKAPTMMHEPDSKVVMEEE